MRSLMWIVPVGVIAGGAGVVRAQVGPFGETVRTILIAPRLPEPAPARPFLPGGASPAVLARLWSFDSDADERLAGHELPERMQALMRGDVNQDGYLDADEIDTLVDHDRPFTRVAGSVPGSLPAGLPGVLSDLRLPPDILERALAIVRSATAVRNVNDPNSLDVTLMHARLRELLDEEEYANFAAAAARMRPAVGVVVVRGVEGGIPRR